MNVKSPLDTRKDLPVYPMGKRTEDTTQPNMSSYPTEQGRTHWHQLEDIRLNLEIANHIAQNQNDIMKIQNGIIETQSSEIGRLEKSLSVIANHYRILTAQFGKRK